MKRPPRRTGLILLRRIVTTLFVVDEADYDDDRGDDGDGNGTRDHAQEERVTNCEATCLNG